MTALVRVGHDDLGPASTRAGRRRLQPCPLLDGEPATGEIAVSPHEVGDGPGRGEQAPRGDGRWVTGPPSAGELPRAQRVSRRMMSTSAVVVPTSSAVMYARAANRRSSRRPEGGARSCRSPGRRLSPLCRPQVETGGGRLVCHSFGKAEHVERASCSVAYGKIGSRRERDPEPWSGWRLWPEGPIHGRSRR